MSHHITTLSRNILLLAALAFCQLAFSQSKTVEVTDPRPVAKAIEMLETIYGLAITYDDPVAVHESQLQDVTEQVQRTPDPSHRVIVQKDVTLSFTYKLPTSESGSGNETGQALTGTEAKVADALTSILDGYAAAGGPVNFTVREEDGVFHVVPTNFVNKEGKLQQMTPILDTKITVAQKQRSAAGLVNEICQTLSQTTGISVDADFPINFFAQHTTTISGADVTARSLLNQLLTELAAPISVDTVVQRPDGRKESWNRVAYKGGPMSWKLFYGPGFGYALNIHKVTLTSQ